MASRQSVTAPIIGASKPQHLDDAVAALRLRLNEQETEALEELYVPHAPVGFS
ncbi:aldo/keto reductase [Stenotrophomonas maltophilia]|uniref:aldo/keto reductase n=1 Tax=Stenotrophomonas maltophilia TaxID=40324 RepID=UPI0023BA5559|nr:aldo/keto reductase [Stenotrophomonas maltophilia]